MATALLAAVKVQERKIQELDAALTRSLTSDGRDTSDGGLSTNAWSVDQQSGKVNVVFHGDINIQGNAILDVGKITGYLGKWSIDEEGKIVIQELEVENAATFKGLTTFKGATTIGTPEKPVGITLYDKVTKKPYCLSMSNGVVVSEEGECGSGSSVNVIIEGSSSIQLPTSTPLVGLTPTPELTSSSTPEVTATSTPAATTIPELSPAATSTPEAAP